MYTKQQILNAAALMRRNPELEITRQGEVIGTNMDIAGMLEDYNRLKHSFIPQVMKHVEPRGDHLAFPHMIKPKCDESS